MVAVGGGLTVVVGFELGWWDAAEFVEEALQILRDKLLVGKGNGGSPLGRSAPETEGVFVIEGAVGIADELAGGAVEAFQAGEGQERDGVLAEIARE